MRLMVIEDEKEKKYIQEIKQICVISAFMRENCMWLVIVI